MATCCSARALDLTTSSMSKLVTAPFAQLADHVRMGNQPSMRLVFDEPEGIPDEYTLLGRLVYPRRAYKWMRQRMILRFNTWNATSQCVQSTGTRCESDLFDGALDRMVEKFTAEFPRHRGSLVPFDIYIYSPFGALLRYVHNDSVSVARPGTLRQAYLQLDGKRLNKSDPSTANLLRRAAEGQPICKRSSRRNLTAVRRGLDS